MINIMVTSGGTMEYIDDVRVLTNVSSGSLGCNIAETLLRLGFGNYIVHYVHSKTAYKPSATGSFLIRHEVKTAHDTLDAMKKIMEENKIGAIIHCMAVSDFTFKRDGAVKLKSNDPEAFIEYMRKTITKNPKIISHIKTWDPRTILVGFKFEVGYSYEQLKEAAENSIATNGCDLVVANDKEEMVKANQHVAHFFFSKHIETKYKVSYNMAFGKDDIAFKIKSFLDKLFIEQ